MYCGLPGHLRASCPTRKPAAVRVISKSATSLEIAVTLEINGRVIEMVALIDSGAAGNLIVSFAKNNSIPLVPCDSHFVMSGGPVCVPFPNQFSLGNPENVPGKLEIHFDDLLVESIQRKTFQEIQKRRKAERRKRAKKRDGSSKDNQPNQENCFIDA